VTVRPSLHGDVLHSRPTVINYGGRKISIISTEDAGGVRTATALDTDVAKIGATGATASLQFKVESTGAIQTCTVRVVSATTFEYPSSNCGDAGPTEASTTESSSIVYYGDNGGVFHAVNGNQVNPAGSSLPPPGGELWGFIPSEMFEKLNRQRTNSPQLDLSSTPSGILPPPARKDYFVDGPVGVFQQIGPTGVTEAAVIFLTMRRGGRLIYALDVTDPSAPKLLWKADNNFRWKYNKSTGSFDRTVSGMSELGQTWSEPKVAYVAGHSGPVLIFGAGYSFEEDEEPPLEADSMGRGIFILDAATGEVVWKATYGGSDACTGNATQASCTVTNMKYSIPADIALVNRDLDRDGLIDRLYAADTGGNIWRVDLEPAAGKTPDKWRVHRLAALGCREGACDIPPGNRAQRKFFYPPEVISTTQGYDLVIAGTGDREHPLYKDPDDTRTNLIVAVKDKYPGKDAAGMTPVTQDGSKKLADATSTGCLDDNGYMIRLTRGEKVVNAPRVTAGVVYLGTNMPSAPEANSCSSTLGKAYVYPIKPFSCEAPVPQEFAGGGLPPSPVSGVVNITGEDGVVRQVPFIIGGGIQGCVGADCSGGSALGGGRPVINVPTTRTRTYWYRQGK
jgi:type IV pilus assembly protein PilY1